MFTPQSSVPTSEPQIGGSDYLHVHYACMQGIFFRPHLHTRQSLQQPRGQHQVNTCSSRKYFRAVENFLRNYKDAHTGIRILPFIKAIPMGINSPIAKFSNGSSHFIFLSVAGLSWFESAARAREQPPSSGDVAEEFPALSPLASALPLQCPRFEKGRGPEGRLELPSNGGELSC